jgi:hypothetical protein
MGRRLAVTIAAASTPTRVRRLVIKLFSFRGITQKRVPNAGEPPRSVSSASPP